jgi:signal transduction histidine kinase/CheY-like chemotaxis protein
VSLGALVDRLLPPRLRHGVTTEARRARVAGGVLILSLVLDLVLGIAREMTGHATPCVFPFAGVMAALLLWLRLRGDVRLLAHALSAVLVLAVSSLALLAGGIGSVAVAAFGIVPLFAVFLGGIRTGAVWLVVSIAGVLAFKAMQVWHMPWPIEPDPTRTMPTLGPIVMAIGIFGIAWAYDSARERDARDLSAREKELRRLLEAFPDLVLRVDENGIVRELFPGRGEANVSAAPIGAPVLEAFAGTEGLADAIARGRSEETELIAKSHHPPRSWMLRIVPYGEHVLVLARDVTLARQMEEQLARARAEAAMERADRLSSIGYLAAGMAHEINNPLAYLSANLGYLEQELTAAGANKALPALADATNAVERIRRIVDDLRLYARHDEDAEDEIVSVREVVSAALKMAHNELQHRATIEVRHRSAPPVLANEARLVQVILNLLVNAAQALPPPGSAHANRVEVMTDTDSEGRASIEVRDSGVGIPPEILGKVMQPFFTTKPAGVGTGLGLSVCDRIVRELGGLLEIESEVGAGTTVRVRLPAAQPSAVQAVKEPSTPRVAPRSGRILIVDDEPLVRRALCRLLRHHDIVEAESGAHALSLLAEDDRFDVILSDVMMPEVTGIELHRRLSAEHPKLAQRIVFMTGGTFDPELKEVIGSFAGKSAIIHKPFRADELRRVLTERMGEAAPSPPPPA